VRVVQLSTFAEACGIATYTEALVDALAGQGVDTTVLSPRPAAVPEHQARVEPARLWSRNRGTTAEAAEVLEAISASRPDLVHLQINAGLFSPEFVAALTAGLRQRGIPSVATLHDRQPGSLIARIRHHALLLALGDAALVVHNAAHAAELSPRAPTIIPHGVTGPTGEVATAERPPDGNFVIAHFGFLLRDKGIAEVIEAVAALRSRGDVRLRYHVLGAVGDGPASRATYRELLRLIRSHQLTETVQLDPSFAPLDDSLRALRRADWIVLNYQSGSAQGTSGAVRHALASGRPVAVSQAKIFDDVREAVHTLQGALPDALAALVQAPRLMTETQARARVFREAHAWERVARLHRVLYEGHIARTKNG
jgi:glycosyltransferase involved in cell wall biosynthesis